jgi:hypothetical protein
MFRSIFWFYQYLKKTQFFYILYFYLPLCNRDACTVDIKLKIILTPAIFVQ